MILISSFLLQKDSLNEQFLNFNSSLFIQNYNLKKFKHICIWEEIFKKRWRKIQSFLIFHPISIHFPPIFPTTGEASPRGRLESERCCKRREERGWQLWSATSLRARVHPRLPPLSFDPPAENSKANEYPPFRLG